MSVVALDGFVVVDKPAGMTSHGVVARLRRLLGTRKVGHAGTLDPMATGVMVCGVGRGTKLLTYLVGADKEYATTIRLGWATHTDDREGEVTSLAAADRVDHVTDPDIGVAVAQHLTGDIMQRPSAVSAIKVNGQRAYALVRAGETPELRSRPVHIYRFDVEPLVRSSASPGETSVTDGQVPVVDVCAYVECSSGSYIRALARDLGELVVGTPGHLTTLRRHRVGPFTLTDAVPLASDGGDVPPLMTLASAAARFLPVVTLPPEQVQELRFGRRARAVADDGRVAACAEDGTLIAIGELAAEVLTPSTVFAPQS